MVVILFVAAKWGATFKEIINFAASPRRATDVVLDGVSVRLIKIKNPKTPRGGGVKQVKT